MLSLRTPCGEFDEKRHEVNPVNYDYGHLLPILDYVSIRKRRPDGGSDA